MSVLQFRTDIDVIAVCIIDAHGRQILFLPAIVHGDACLRLAGKAVAAGKGGRLDDAETVRNGDQPDFITVIKGFYADVLDGLWEDGLLHTAVFECMVSDMRHAVFDLQVP